MHLQAIKLRGFKSFPDPVEIRLEPGVAVVVGPNGSGKSNVADAITWAAGSLSPSELRAEKPDDVLFAGGGDRKTADFCEVELVFDNQDGGGPVDDSELSIARRLHRGGEGQYLLNRTHVRRIDLVELLADLGVSVWDDRYIPPGARWSEAIENAVRHARVAVLLVSNDFRTSDYITKTEVPLLREQAARRPLPVLWVSVDGSLPEEPERALQGVGSPERPLAGLDDAAADRVLAELARAVTDEYRRTSPRDGRSRDPAASIPGGADTDASG